MGATRAEGGCGWVFGCAHRGRKHEVREALGKTREQGALRGEPKLGWRCISGAWCGKKTEEAEEGGGGVERIVLSVLRWEAPSRICNKESVCL